MTDHEKRPLPKAVIFTKTRYIGFQRVPVSDSSPALITGVPEPTSDYKLANGHRWIDNREQS